MQPRLFVGEDLPDYLGQAAGLERGQQRDQYKSSKVKARRVKSVLFIGCEPNMLQHLLSFYVKLLNTNNNNKVRKKKQTRKKTKERRKERKTKRERKQFKNERNEQELISSKSLDQKSHNQKKPVPHT